MAKSRAIAGLCLTTEANLGDGISRRWISSRRAGAWYRL